VIIENVNFLNNADVDGKNLPPNGAPNIIMAAGGRQMDKIMARLVYRNVNGNESIVAVHSVNTAFGGGGVRW